MPKNSKQARYCKEGCLGADGCHIPCWGQLSFTVSVDEVPRLWESTSPSLGRIFLGIITCWWTWPTRGYNPGRQLPPRCYPPPSRRPSLSVAACQRRWCGPPRLVVPLHLLFGAPLCLQLVPFSLPQVPHPLQQPPHRHLRSVGQRSCRCSFRRLFAKTRLCQQLHCPMGYSM
jgi:hypothetical protein